MRVKYILYVRDNLQLGSHVVGGPGHPFVVVFAKNDWLAPHYPTYYMST